MKGLLVFVLLLCGVAQAAPTVVARLNENPIYLFELEQFKKPDESRESALNRLLLYKLAVADARRKKLEEKPQVKDKIDRALYEGYLDRAREKNQAKVEPTANDLKLAYEAAPMIRLRHLVLFAKDEAQKTAAEKTLRTIQEGLKAGRTFKQLVLSHSEDPGSKFAGDLDFRGPKNLPPRFYETGLELKKGQVSDPFELDGAIHMVQLLDRQPFTKAPATYLTALKNELRSRNETSLLEAQLQKLKRQAKIEVLNLKEPK